MLQLSTVPSSLPCREDERQRIETILEDAIRNGQSGSTLYISGMPGTGKTATMRAVLRRLQRKSRGRGGLPPFRTLEVNGMKLPRPQDVYRTLWQELGRQSGKLEAGRRVGLDRSLELLERHFSTSSSKRQFTVLVVDELDYMINQKQTVLYKLFEWPTRRHSRFIVVGIANRMNLPEALMPRVGSRMGLERVQVRGTLCTDVYRCVLASVAYLSTGRVIRTHEILHTKRPDTVAHSVTAPSFSPCVVSSAV